MCLISYSPTAYMKWWPSMNSPVNARSRKASGDADSPGETRMEISDYRVSCYRLLHIRFALTANFC